MEDSNPFADSNAEDYGANPKAYESLETPPPAQEATSTRSYAHYFQISPEQLRSRLISALTLKKLQESGELEPDLYAPVWVTATVVAALFFAHSLRILTVAFIQDVLPQSNEYSKLTSSALLFYGYIGLMSLGTHLVCGHVLKINLHVTLVSLVCIYGYANVIWVPVAVASSVANIVITQASNLFGWACVVAGGIHSACLLYRQLHDACEEEDAARWKIVLIVLLAVNAGFACAVKAVVF